MTLTCRGEATQTPSWHDTIVPMSRTLVFSLAALSIAVSAMAQAPASGQRVRRLPIHNAMVIDGNGTPASGPKDIVIENNLTHLLHHAGGSGPFPIGCNFENGLVTRFLSA